MASPFWRRRKLIFKVIIGIPVLWFSAIGFVVVMSGGGAFPDVRSGSQPSQQFGAAAVPAPSGTPGAPTARREPHIVLPGEQPILNAPDPDRLRFEEKMHADAERQLRQREEELRQQRLAASAGAGAATPKPDPNAPGEMGKAVIIKKEELSVEERKKFDEGWQKNAFNQYASDMISEHRSLPDVRDPSCKKVQYRPLSELPDTSVIIIFHNEAWSVLRRTVFSVLDRSPPQLINEVILVDDASDLPHLQQPLADFVASHPKLRLRRAKKREGLIRARLLGAAAAKGQVLTFLDSHCECTEGWLEPMLDRIAEAESNVVTPVIDVVDDDTLRYQYSAAKATSVGGFDWNLQFNWHSIPEHERLRRSKDSDPVRSPTMAGGLFAISRKYFEHLGTYDPGMDIWGGENLELSFRVWMCGGTLEIIPCSHVGHIFRKRSPYSWKTGVNVVKKNSIRLAEVWMDDYKGYYYERFNNDLGDYGDVSARKALRQKLGCKSFDWFIHNIYPELFIPGDSVASGEIRSKVRAQCLDSAVDKHAHNKPVKMWPCHNMGGNQYWMLSKSGEIRRDEGCMDYAGQFVMIYPCHSMRGNQEWVYGPDNTLRHHNTNLCMELSADGQKVDMKPCTGTDRQIWLWKRKVPDDEKRKQGIPILR